jgi:hypothetical protein
MSTPSNTNTNPAMGWESPTTTRAAANTDRTAGSEVNSTGSTECVARTRVPSTPPPNTPQASIVRVADRALAMSPAPNARPVSA